MSSDLPARSPEWSGRGNVGADGEATSPYMEDQLEASNTSRAGFDPNHHPDASASTTKGISSPDRRLAKLQSAQQQPSMVQGGMSSSGPYQGASRSKMSQGSYDETSAGRLDRLGYVPSSAAAAGESAIGTRHYPDGNGHPYLHDEEDSRYYTYSTDEGDAEPSPSTPPELVEDAAAALLVAQQAQHYSTSGGTNSSSGERKKKNRLSIKTPRDAPISTVVTSSEERRRRDAASAHSSRKVESGSGSSGRRSSPNNQSRRRRRRSHRRGGIDPRPSVEETSTSGTSHDAYFDQDMGDPHAAWSSAFRQGRPQHHQYNQTQYRNNRQHHQNQNQHYQGNDIHYQMPQPYHYQLQQPQSHQVHDEHDTDDNVMSPGTEWPAAFQDARYRGHGYDESTAAAAAGAAAAAAASAATSYGNRSAGDGGMYGSLVHPLATPESSVASGSAGGGSGYNDPLSPPPLNLPAPRLLPRTSNSMEESSPEMLIRDFQPTKKQRSPATMETGDTVPMSNSFLSKVDEAGEADDEEGGDGDLEAQNHNIDDADEDEEDDEHIGLLPDHLRTSLRGGRVTMSGTAYLHQPNSPISMITTDTGGQSSDASLSPLQDRSSRSSARSPSRGGRGTGRGRVKSKGGRYSRTGSRRNMQGDAQPSSSLLPSHYVPGTKSSYGSTVGGGSRSPQELYQDPPSLAKSGSHPSASSTAHMSKKALRRHRRKKEETEAREHAVRAIRGVEQPPSSASSDRIWAILFLIQLVIVITVAFALGPSAVMSDDATTAIASNSSGQRLTTKPPADDPGLFDDDVVISKTVPATDDYTYLLPPNYEDEAAKSSSGNGAKPTQETPSSSKDDSTSGSNPTSPVILITDSISDGWSKIQVDYRNALQICCITGLYAAALTSLTIGFMMILAKSLIQTALIFTILICFAWGTVGIVLSPYSFVPILGFIALALSLGYAVVIWDSIPFWACNLSTALTGVRCVADTLLLGFIMLVLTFFWCIIWGFAFIGTYDNLSDGSETIPWLPGTNGLVLSLLLVSMFWTYNVFTGIIQAVVAGSIGNWWYEPESVNACCSNASRTPLVRALTSSFGSICCGSLLVKPIQFFKNLMAICCFANNSSGVLHNPKQHHREKSSKDDRGGRKRRSSGRHRPQAAEPASTGCCGPCGRMRRYFLRALDSLCKIFNHWAFVNIGLYNYDFWDSGKKASALFNTRGWTGIVSNRVVHNVLFMTSIVIGLCTGLFGLIVEEFDGYEFTSFNKPTATAFVIGSLIGMALSGVMLSVLGSATNAVLVCFAAGNVEFSRIHPQLSNEMRESWATVWTGYFVD